MSARTACVILGIVATTGIGLAQQGTAQGEWTRYGGDPGSTKYAPLDQINKTNVSGLRIAWRRPAVDPSISSRVPGFSYSTNFRSTPLMIGGVLYSPNGIGLVEAFNPATGRTIWVQQPFPDEPAQGLRGDSTRGVTYWTDGTERRLYVVRGEYLIALDLRSGQPIPSFGEKGRVNLRPGLGPRAALYSWTGAAQVCRDVVIVGVGLGAMSDRPQNKEQAPGNVQAFDVRTGKPRWTVQSHCRTRRSRRRHLGEGLLGVHRRGEPLVVDQRGRGAGVRVPSADERHQRHVRRPSARQQRIRQHPGLRQLSHRRAGLALSDRPPRSLGLRFAGRTHSRGHHGRRHANPRGRAVDETGVRVRLRSHDGKAGVADRRATGSRLRHAR